MTRLGVGPRRNRELIQGGRARRGPPGEQESQPGMPPSEVARGKGETYPGMVLPQDSNPYPGMVLPKDSSPYPGIT